MRQIKILGAGISGLTSAINLAKAGFDVEINEIKNYSGKQTNDFQYLENWTTDENVLDYIAKMGIEIDFYHKVWEEQSIMSPSGLIYTGRSTKPLMYLVKRGSAEDSIDSCLAKQAQKYGVTIKYESVMNKEDVDILSYGPTKIGVLASGIKFPCNLTDRSYILLDNNLSLHFYSYFIVNDGIGEITSCNPVKGVNHQEKLNTVIETFQKLLKFEVGKITNKFAGGVTIIDELKYTNGKQINTGEAVGFQDCLAGFGMLYAIRSGFLSAQSIIKQEDYQKLCEHDLQKIWEVSKINRKYFDKLNNDDYEKIVKIALKSQSVLFKIIGGNNIHTILHAMYTKPVSKILFPVFKYIER